ncbi:MAG: hypothetical protein KDC34_16190 [Saprospiraceae bacterium]|nr:hypothetical protein [Saprospiraceae bacterium]
MSDPTDIKIRFFDRLAPSLTAGPYRITVETALPGILGMPQRFGRSEEWIYVGGKRFNFDASDIDSVFPPTNGNGAYAGVLPHIVFYQKGLPWERKPGADFEEGTPWLALMLLDQDDPAPKIQEIRLGDLPQDETKSEVYFPGFKLEPGEDSDKKCQFFDLPRDLFEAIKPSPKELKILAHSREVNMFPKANGNVEPDELHTFSVVIGNRLPRTGKESVVHLVSFENYGKVLENPLEEKFHSIRLLSLRNWRFSTEDKGGSFLDAFRQLNENTFAENNPVSKHESPLQLHYPVALPNGRQNNKKLIPLHLLRHGFFPMEHRFRHGRKGLSWYRGPFTPDRVECAPQLSPPFPSADSLLIYDPNAGQFDVSYAAAWQLGQLLALKNKSFAKALYFWKQQRAINTRKELENDILKEELPVQSHMVTDAEGNSRILLGPDFDQIKISEESGLNTPAEDAISKSSSNVQIKLAAQIDLESDQGVSGVNKPAPIVLDQNYRIIQKFVQSLRILRPVPYNYLIPDEKYLPSESIRFFQVDPNWVNALVDGACSIGDLLPTDFGRRTVVDPKGLNKPAPDRYYGFLMRSKMITVWPGVEIRFNEGTTDNPTEGTIPVRHERLADDLIISILPSVIKTVEFRLPAEGLHFGVTYSRSGYSKGIREKGKDSANWDNVPVSTNDKQRINLEELAKSLGEDAANFAFRMVQSAQAVSLSLDYK